MSTGSRATYMTEMDENQKLLLTADLRGVAALLESMDMPESAEIVWKAVEALGGLRIPEDSSLDNVEVGRSVGGLGGKAFTADEVIGVRVRWHEGFGKATVYVLRNGSLPAHEDFETKTAHDVYTKIRDWAFGTNYYENRHVGVMTAFRQDPVPRKETFTLGGVAVPHDKIHEVATSSYGSEVTFYLLGKYGTTLASHTLPTGDEAERVRAELMELKETLHQRRQAAQTTNQEAAAPSVPMFDREDTELHSEDYPLGGPGTRDRESYKDWFRMRFNR